MLYSPISVRGKYSSFFCDFYNSTLNSDKVKGGNERTSPIYGPLAAHQISENTTLTDIVTVKIFRNFLRNFISALKKHIWRDDTCMTKIGGVRHLQRRAF